MVNKKDFGPLGMKMALKNLKESLIMVKEIASGPLGIKTVTKNFKLHTQMVN